MAQIKQYITATIKAGKAGENGKLVSSIIGAGLDHDKVIEAINDGTKNEKGDILIRITVYVKGDWAFNIVRSKNDCFDGLVGIAPLECECAEQIAEERKKSKSNIFLSDIVTLKGLLSKCTDDDYYSIEEAYRFAVQTIKKDASALLAARYKQRRQAAKNQKIGKVGKLVSVEAGKYAVWIVTAPLQYGILRINSIRFQYTIKESKNIYSVIVESYTNKIKLITAIRNITGMSLSDALKLVNKGVPITVIEETDVLDVALDASVTLNNTEGVKAIVKASNGLDFDIVNKAGDVLYSDTVFLTDGTPTKPLTIGLELEMESEGEAAQYFIEMRPHFDKSGVTPYKTDIKCSCGGAKATFNLANPQYNRYGGATRHQWTDYCMVAGQRLPVWGALGSGTPLQETEGAILDLSFSCPITSILCKEIAEISDSEYGYSVAYALLYRWAANIAAAVLGSGDIGRHNIIEREQWEALEAEWLESYNEHIVNVTDNIDGSSDCYQCKDSRYISNERLFS